MADNVFVLCYQDTLGSCLCFKPGSSAPLSFLYEFVPLSLCSVSISRNILCSEVYFDVNIVTLDFLGVVVIEIFVIFLVVVVFWEDSYVENCQVYS